MAEEKKRVGAGLGVLMIRNGRVLLGKRDDDPVKASSELRGEGTWTCPGGKFEWGESLFEGAKREVLEETGIALKKLKIIAVNCDKNEHAHFVTVGFLGEDFEGEPKALEPEEITEWKWFDFDDLPKKMYPPSIKLIECYKKGKITE